LNIGSKSVGEFAAYFLLGYFVLSLEEVQEKLIKHRVWLVVFWVLLMVWRCIMYKKGLSDSLLWNLEQRLLAWIGILALLGMGKRYLEFNNKFTAYFTPAAFPIYLFHQSIIVIVGYFTIRHVEGTVVQYIIIALFSLIITLLMYELCRRIRMTRFLFGIKSK
jgi:peptidoglycan/LPS O-acetylase OafA/YrhL